VSVAAIRQGYIQLIKDNDMNATQLLRPSTFCNVLARARSARARGWWDGSAYRSHPCGLLVGNMNLTNYWNVNDYCSIVIATSDKWKLGMDNPAVSGDPHPHPIDGTEVRVWSNGRWESEEFRVALEDRVVAILNRALADAAAAESWKRVLDMHAQETSAKKRSAIERAALALAVGA
jgi:hypothetical protein